MKPVRVVSTLPAATEIICALGYGQALAGVSHECGYPAPAKHLPRVTSINFDYAAASSAAIDTHVKTNLHEHRSLYQLDGPLLQRLRPTHLITQQLCEVCAITPNDIQAVIHDLATPPALLSLNAHTLTDILGDIRRVGDFLGASRPAAGLIKALRQTMVKVATATAGLTPKTVFCVEWLTPLFATGHWVPEMVELAGGRDIIAAPGQTSAQVRWSDVAAGDPEVLILMPCGFPRAKTLAELKDLQRLPEWPHLRAVRTGQVWIVDGPAYFSQSGPRVISEGITLLAQILHPTLFGSPPPTKTQKLMV
jgi:iron complex transport system substrate-binding protein